MAKKPKPVECSICGEMIEPFYDSGQWVTQAASLMLPVGDGKLESSPDRFHMECMEHAALWKRIRALEGR